MLNIKKIIPLAVASALFAAPFISADEKNPADEGVLDENSNRNITSVIASHSCILVALAPRKVWTRGGDEQAYASEALTQIGTASVMNVVELKGAYFDPTASRHMIIACIKKLPKTEGAEPK